MDPIAAATAAWSIAKNAGEIGRKLYEIGKSVKDRDVKQQIDEITDALRELKQQAANLEDENRELREQLRFKGDDFEFRTPFWYEKAHPDRPLCAKCFAQNKAAPMGEPGQGSADNYRRCLVCLNPVKIGPQPQQRAAPRTGYTWG